ncbi:reverse transcriptase domain-containing protein [Tanacetum coccineum]|uniref:Reverse transcriptase domain-containing protein n=1 Tax=Tanacetum coccineum TaxID=301880 RepID=A0ABQ5CA60_9ASTR
MSSPNHPTSDIKDVFSSNFPDYIPASPDYVPEFFISEKLLPLKKRGRDRSSSFTSVLPQAFKIGESSRKTSLERHEKQIEEILNHLDELSLDRIEHIEDKIEGLGKERKWEIRARMLWLAYGLLNLETNHRRYPAAKSSHDAATYQLQMYGRRVGLICWFDRTEIHAFSRSNCTEDCKVKFATGTLTEEALSWWNSFAQPIGIEEAYKITWVEFKKLLIKKYYPRTEVQKMEDEFYHLTREYNLKGIW